MPGTWQRTTLLLDIHSQSQSFWNCIFFNFLFYWSIDLLIYFLKSIVELLKCCISYLSTSFFSILKCQKEMHFSFSINYRNYPICFIVVIFIFCVFKLYWSPDYKDLTTAKARLFVDGKTIYDNDSSLTPPAHPPPLISQCALRSGRHRSGRTREKK